MGNLAVPGGPRVKQGPRQLQFHAMKILPGRASLNGRAPLPPWPEAHNQARHLAGGKDADPMVVSRGIPMKNQGEPAPILVGPTRTS